MKIMSVVGARPNFMKVAPIINAIKNHNSRVSEADTAIQHVLVHTGQHYDQAMSDSFFSDLGLPEPDAHLGVGSGSHALQTSEVMRKFEDVLLSHKPEVLVVVGDVNSTLACALVAAKISIDGTGTRPLIAHVEAGLRSFDRSMPEEINRILTDQLSDLLFVTEESAIHNLANEGAPAQSVHFTGNTMIDSVLACIERAEQSTILNRFGLERENYALLTLHRPANVDTHGPFENILEGISELAGTHSIIFPVHPRTRKRIPELGLENYFVASDLTLATGIRMVEPLGYLDFLALMKSAKLVITDSGGIQEETTCLGIPCVTVRENTERPVTISAGTNLLAGVSVRSIQEAIQKQLRPRRRGTRPEKWDGKSAERIVEVICRAAEKPGAYMRSAKHSTEMAHA